MGQIESTISLATMPASPIESLLRKINEESDLPTLGIAIAKVVEITSSDEDSVARLAHFILSDVGLTQKILRLANSVQYRPSSSTAVTTISRSIFLLGFNTVKTSAMSMLLIDFFKDKAQATSVRHELIQSLCASIIGREMSQRGRYQNNEEAAVAALFKNIGSILVASYDYQLYSQIKKISDSIGSNANDTAKLQLGCSFERFGEIVLQEWGIPNSIIQSMQQLPVGELKKPSTRIDWLKHVASFSNELAQTVVMGIHESPENIDALLKKYGNALEIDRKILDAMLSKAAAETHQFAKTLNITLPSGYNPSKELKVSAGISSEFLLKSEELAIQPNEERHPSGKPFNARELLLAGVQDVTQMLASEDMQLNELFLLALETLYSSLGFRFATVCFRDLANGRYVSRTAIGEDYANRQRGFNFGSKSEADLFHLAMNNNVDVMITDAMVPKTRVLLPLWHQELLPDARSFMILPLVIQKKPLGLFYADRAVIADEGIPTDEAALIKTLKSQILAAMMRSYKMATLT